MTNASPTTKLVKLGQQNVKNRRILGKVFRAQEGVYRLQSASPNTKAAQISQKMAKISLKLHLSALAGNQTVVALVINYSTSEQPFQTLRYY